MSEPVIRPFRRQQLSEQELLAFHRFQVRTRAEVWSDDPPPRLEETARRLARHEVWSEVHSWSAWEGPEVVAHCDLHLSRMEQNRHAAYFHVQVDPPHRRRGLATRLLAPLPEVCRADGRSLLITDSYRQVEAGAAFLERLGAALSLESHTNQLEVADADPALLAAWVAEARLEGLEPVWWEGPFPEADYPLVIAMKEAINGAPLGSLSLEDEHLTPELLRKSEEQLRREGTCRWTLLLRETATGRPAGYTETFWHPDRPEFLQQGDTAVFPEFRCRGLGKWLKASMFRHVLAQRPGIARVRTGNADSNGPMLRINHAMGFRPYRSELSWQLPVEQVERYLAQR